MNRPAPLLTRLLLGGGALLLASCDAPGDPGEASLPDRVPVQVSAVEVGLEPDGFAWLRPLSAGRADGPLVSGLAPVVRICDLAPTDNVGCATVAASEDDDAYAAEWNTERSWRDHRFSLEAMLQGIVVARAEVLLEQGGAQNAGRTLPIRFWIGEDLAVADCLGDDRCNAEGIDPAVGATIITRDENGNIMAALTIPPNSAPEPIQIVLDCREDGYAPATGPLPTSLDQWPLFCKVDATDLAGNPFTGSLAPSNPATIEICVVDDLITSQGPWHGFSDHTALVLGKSNGPSSFEYLPVVGTPTLPDCVGRTVTTADVGGFGDLLDRTFDGLLDLVGPTELHASRVRRDGGVGGTLSAFSDINPVSPAYIDVSVTDFGGSPVPGVTIDVAGGGFSASAATDGTGVARFLVPSAPGGGTTYGVTLDESTLPGAPLLGSNTRSVAVPGSGTFTAAFTTGGQQVIVGFGSTYEYVVPGLGSGVGPAPFFTSGYPYAPCPDLTAPVSTGTGGWSLGSTILLEVSVLVPAGTTSLEILAWVDNDARVEVEGTDVTGAGTGGTYEGPGGFRLHEGCANVAPLSFPVATGQFTPGATNEFRLEVRDRGVIGFADFQITAVAGGSE